MVVIVRVFLRVGQGTALQVPDVLDGGMARMGIDKKKELIISWESPAIGQPRPVRGTGNQKY